MSKKHNRFDDIPDPNEQVKQITEKISKYKLGERGFSFHFIKHLKPTFAFDYLSFKGTEICFNSEYLELKDYIGLLEGLKKVSTITYDELSRTPIFRFHKIDFDDSRVTINRKDFKSALTFKENLLDDNDLPTLYQFDLQYVQEARVCGFLFKGVFYLVWYDRHHEIYKRK